MAADAPPPGDERDQAAVPAPPGGLLDLLSVAAIVLDDRGKIVFWSPQAEELFGYT
ncbi:MAG TPA: PAS domain-containing protein, partial [Yinghuangia sp.]|nr:PAS domain-containing protein [Yinghuangia sp.]